MGDLVQFPARGNDDEFFVGVAMASPNVTLTIYCDAPIHWFTQGERRCQCGQKERPDDR